MGIGFLAPLFILGLAALVVPVLVHLIQRDRKEVVRFPSLMFLEKVPYRSTRRQTIRHWTLFLVRSLAVALLAFAFARPLFQGDRVAGASDRGPREVVVLLDASYSMAAEDRFDEARTAAAEIFTGLRPGDRASLIQFDEDARGVRRSDPDASALIAELEALEVGSEGTRYGPALRLAQTILETTDQPVREVHLISDFQERAWSGSEELALPEGTEVIAVPVGGGTIANAAVAGVTFRRDSRQERERVTATARVVNLGLTPMTAVPVQLSMGDRTLQTLTVDLAPFGEAGSTQVLDFEPFTVSDVDTRGRVSLAGDALPADDDFHFVLSPEAGLSILIVEPGRPRADVSLYLTRALEIGETPGFRVQVRRANRLSAADIQSAAVVVFNGAGLPEPLTDALRTHVNGGGGLLVALDEGTTWPSAAQDLLPAVVGSARNRTGGALGWVDVSHPAFETLAVGADFAAARVFRYRAVEPDSLAEVVARFDDGAPALLERRGAEGGRVMMWATATDTYWNDLAIQPVYLPFMQRIAAYLAGVEGADPWHTVGASVDLAALWDGSVGKALEQGERWLVAGPVGDPVELESGRDGGAFVRLDHQGVYEVRPARTGATGRWLAANADRSESNLRTVDPAELTASVLANTGGSAGVTPATAGVRAEDRERRQSVWWYLMAVVFGLLMVDTVLGNRLSRKPA